MVLLSRYIKKEKRNEIVEVMPKECCRTKEMKDNEKLIEEKTIGGH